MRFGCDCIRFFIYMLNRIPSFFLVVFVFAATIGYSPSLIP